MTVTEIILKRIDASENMVLTNGEAYSSVGGYITLGKNDNEDNWYEITAEEYESKMAEIEANEVNEYV